MLRNKKKGKKRRGNIKREKESIIKIRFYLQGIVSLIVFWYLMTYLLIIGNAHVKVFPYPHTVIKDFFKLLFVPYDGRTLIQHALASLLRVLLGFGYAFIIAVPLGVLAGNNKKVEQFITPIIELLRPIPPIAWIPFAIIIFGLGTSSYSFIIFMGSFFPLFQNVYDGTKRVETVYKEVALSLGASNMDIVWEVTLPSILPNVLTGMRVSLGVGWMSVIAAEMMGLIGAGIGYFINYMKNIGQYSYMMAGMLMIGLIGIFLEGGFKLLEKHLLKWREQEA